MATWALRPQLYIVGAVFAATLKHSSTMTNRAAPPSPSMVKMRSGTPTKAAESQVGMAKAAVWATAPRIWTKTIGTKNPMNTTTNSVGFEVCEGRLLVYIPVIQRGSIASVGSTHEITS
jgi:hypothetical protein